MSNSWFVVAFDFVYGLAADTEVLIRQLLDGDSEELLRDMHYLGCRCCQPLYQLSFLFSGESAALD